MIDAPPYQLLDPDPLESPSLLIFRDLVERNLDAMIQIAGGVDRLRPHAKTHKSADVIRMFLKRGVRKHKCATIAEAEMLAEAGADDVLLAYPLVGPNPDRYVRLIAAFPETTFRALVDSPDAAQQLSQAASGRVGPIPTLIDLDVGMGRTGIAPDDAAFTLYESLARLPGLTPDGLHAYDGHLNDPDLETRTRAARAAEEVVLSFRDRLISQGLPVSRLVMGGTPTFAIHASFHAPGAECSPGTVTYHDHSYATKFPDLPFTPAALLLTRLVSRPRPGRACLDLGHKAVAADPSGPRAFLPALPDAKFIVHSEEHLVIESPSVDHLRIGEPLLAIPTHVCPTSALHRRLLVVVDGRVVDEWEVTARDRHLRF
ncbi:D-TA family PLP-dependent enzyme [Planctomyces sp. SH-PL62]|uniref:D-TA family PLP-dependent enzyme n=1 Tax=Planctomyces sp. SH-PL62 TaxID=1636152 RepID=UPI00078D2495|nr:D-TA family PLP-dependent enzyme [Planctomyces sp. SH-PL62]AMV36870.1 D-threonine aldolase [Planctomyces sp. SH-PL62]